MSRLALALLVACAHPGFTSQEMGKTHVVVDHSPSRARRRIDMHQHYDDLRFIDAALRAGRLREARTLAYWLARAPQDPLVQASARELASAPTLVAALYAEARIAGACGRCHRSANVRAAFERDTIAPRQDGTSTSGLVRHRWAAARLVDGVVGDSEVQWRAGLALFSDGIAARAREATSGDRAAIYGDLLIACTACHPRTMPSNGP